MPPSCSNAQSDLWIDEPWQLPATYERFPPYKDVRPGKLRSSQGCAKQQYNATDEINQRARVSAPLMRDLDSASTTSELTETLHRRNPTLPSLSLTPSASPVPSRAPSPAPPDTSTSAPLPNLAPQRRSSNPMSRITGLFKSSSPRSPVYDRFENGLGSGSPGARGMARNGAWKKWAVGLFVGIVLLWAVTPAERRPGKDVSSLDCAYEGPVMYLTVIHADSQR